VYDVLQRILYDYVEIPFNETFFEVSDWKATSRIKRFVVMLEVVYLNHTYDRFFCQSLDNEIE